MRRKENYNMDDVKENLLDNVIAYPNLNIDNIHIGDKIYLKQLIQITEKERYNIIEQYKEKNKNFNYKDDEGNSCFHKNFIFKISDIKKYSQEVNIECIYNNYSYILPLIDNINNRKFLWKKESIDKEKSHILIFNVPIIDILKISQSNDIICIHDKVKLKIRLEDNIELSNYIFSVVNLNIDRYDIAIKLNNFIDIIILITYINNNNYDWSKLNKEYNNIIYIHGIKENELLKIK